MVDTHNLVITKVTWNTINGFVSPLAVLKVHVKAAFQNGGFALAPSITLMMMFLHVLHYVVGGGKAGVKLGRSLILIALP